MQVIDTQHVIPYHQGTGRRRALLFHRKKIANAVAMMIGDGLALVVAFLISGALRYWLFDAALIPVWSLLLLPGWCIAAFSAHLLPGWGMGVVEEFRRTVILLCLLFGGVAIVLFLTKQSIETSRFTLSVAFLMSLLLVPCARIWVKRGLMKAGIWGVPTVIYGGAPTTHRLVRALKEGTELGYKPIGVFDDDANLWGDHVDGIPVLGDIEQSTTIAPVAILAMPHITREHMLTLLDGPLSQYKQVVIIPDLFEIPSLWVESRSIAGILGLEITSTLLDPVTQVMKRLLDLLLIIATVPIWGSCYLIIAAAIWLEDRHSPLFMQERVGKSGKLFRVHKFRTMHPDAEEMLQRELTYNAQLREEWESNFKLRKDPRITRVGAFLRRTSLDEIPQLINVLRGEMSLVGPRPLPSYHQSELPPHIQRLRTRVRPGITGLWQVSGRSDSGTEGMERWDAYYVRNGSIWLDIVTLLRTLRAVLCGKGAY